MESTRFWILTDPRSLGQDVAGLRTPDAAAAVVIDGYATDDGKNFEYPPFKSGKASATFMVLPKEVGERVYEKTAAHVISRRSIQQNVEGAIDNEVLAAKWNLEDGRVALLVADAGESENVQDAFERFLGSEKISLQRSEFAVIAHRFSAATVLQSGVVLSEDARFALEALRCDPVPALAPSLRKPRRG